MTDLVIGSLQFPAEMLLGPLGTAVGFVMDLVVDQIKLWESNKFEASKLQQLLVQTRGHMQLLRDLAAQLAGKQDRADISTVIGDMLSDYKQLGEWLFRWNAESATAFGRLRDWGKKVAKAQKYAAELSMQKERISNAFVKNMGIINVLLSGKVLEGQDMLKLGQDKQMQKLSDKLVLLRSLEDSIQDKAAEDGIREVDIELSKEVLGRGAFGVVRKATLKKDGKKVEVAVKMLQSCFSGDKLAAKFKKEIDLVRQAHRKCSPTYVCRFYGACSINDQLCLVMKRYTSSLAAFVKEAEGGKLDLELSCQLGLRIAVGLQELHQAGLAHLDIKPANVLLDLANNPVLCDFALARHFRDNSGTVYVTSNRIGTPNYMAPECVASEDYAQLGGISFKADIWSFAATMVHMLTGAPPFSGLSEAKIYHQLLSSTPPAVPQEFGDVSKMLASCFSFAPASRPNLTKIIEILKTASPMSNPQPAPAAPPPFHGDSARNNKPEVESKDAGGWRSWCSQISARPENDSALANLREVMPAVEDLDMRQRDERGKQGGLGVGLGFRVLGFRV